MFIFTGHVGGRKRENYTHTPSKRTTREIALFLYDMTRLNKTYKTKMIKVGFRVL